MQPKLSPLLMATAALGVLALGGLGYVFLGNQGSAPAPTPNAGAPAPTPTPVPSVQWVARYNIPPRTMVTPDMLRRQSVAGKSPDGAITDLSQINGEITNDTIAYGQPVTLTSFTPSIKRVIPANFAIPTSYRAVAVYVDSTSTAAGLVDVGDHVDVIAVHRLTMEKEKNQMVVGATQFSAGRLIGTDLRVLAVDKSLEAPPPTPTPAATAAGQAAPAAGNAPPPTPTPPPGANGNGDRGAPSGGKIRVLLAAPVDVATRLVAANDQGTLHLTIRNPADSDSSASPEAREYPSRLVTQKEVSAQARDIGRNVAKGMQDTLGPIPKMPPMGTGMMPTPAPPVVVTVVPTPGPTGPPTTDITVIRGTEKTRVIVPQRG